MNQKPQTVDVILNAGAHQGDTLFADAVREPFATHDVSATVHQVGEGESLSELVDRVIQGGSKCVVAAGGDGTINAVAARVIETSDVVLGVLPAGTLNHFAGDLGIDDELSVAAGVIAAGHVRQVDVGEVNGQVFLNNSSIGLYADMVALRIREQKRLHIGKWPALAKAGWASLMHPKAFSVVLRADGKELRRTTPFVFVGNNMYVLQGLQAGERASLDDGSLCVYVVRPCGTAGLLWLALRTLMGTVSTQRDLDALCTTELVVESAAKQTRVARDGEVDLFDTPVKFRVRPRALRVYAPANNGESS